VTATYVVVCFSIVVQGLTVEAVVGRLLGSAKAAE
jgi:NhaP-type Na+/H+ or K+/H+ antiporter